MGCIWVINQVHINSENTLNHYWIKESDELLCCLSRAASVLSYACPRIIKQLLLCDVPSRKRKRIYRYIHIRMHPKCSRDCMAGLGLLNLRENKAATAFSPVVLVVSGRNETIWKQQYTFRKTWGVPYCKARKVI